MKIYNLGSLNIDYVYSVEHIVNPKETIASNNLKKFAGGKGLNQSIALSRAGCNVIHGGIIGNDGAFLKEVLIKDNVDISHIIMLDKSTGHAIIQVDKNGQNSILLYSGTNHLIDREYVKNFLKDSQEDDILLLQNETSALEYAFEIAKNNKIQIALNPSPYSENLKNLPLQYVNWWFCNEVEASELFGSSDIDVIKNKFISQYPNSNLILTLGEYGSIFINQNNFIRQIAYKTNVVDTTSAGDTFTGYFLGAISQNKTVKDAMEIASKAASITVSRNGAATSIPYITEI